MIESTAQPPNLRHLRSGSAVPALPHGGSSPWQAEMAAHLFN